MGDDPNGERPKLCDFACSDGDAEASFLDVPVELQELDGVDCLGAAGTEFRWVDWLLDPMHKSGIEWQGRTIKGLAQPFELLIH